MLCSAAAENTVTLNLYSISLSAESHFICVLRCEFTTLDTARCMQIWAKPPQQKSELKFKKLYILLCTSENGTFVK